MKHRYILLIVSLIICLFLSSIVVAKEEEELIDPDIPDSWYEAPKIASEMNIEDFQQSPMLDERVSEGELPPVKERLPEDPIVQEPYNKIGEYGGTAVLWDGALNDYELNYWNNWFEGIGTMLTPDAKERIPFYLKGWDYSEDYKEFTIKIREGMKWSDGEKLTADDYLYWWEHYANNEVLSPTPPEKWDPPLVDVTKEDKYTITFHYGNEFPGHEIVQGQGMITNDLGPAHYMKQFHPDFIGKDEAKKLAEEAGLERWEQFYQRIQEDSPSHPEYEYQRPVLSPYIAVERTETSLIVERNPYSPLIDSEGNQLPYIDRIRVNLANNAEMAATKGATGEATVSGRNVQTSDIPLYKNNEEKENFETLIYTRAYGSELEIKPNFTTNNERLREILHDDRFRKALSLAIDRDGINNKVYYGRAIPRQGTILPGSKYFEKEFAESYAEYDPERAKEFLDDMGMVDEDGDGYREGPDGELFEPELLYCKVGPIEPTQILEMVKSDFEDIGININLKKVSRELWVERMFANDLEITAWTLGQMTPYKGPWIIYHWLAPAGFSSAQRWMGYRSWYQTDGEEGLEPPAKMKELVEYARTARYNLDENKRDKALKNILREHSENLWGIGTVGMGPQPVLINEDLKNVPEKGIWDASTQYLMNYRPWQFYLEE